MKKTRRVEIIRYTRRSTIISSQMVEESDRPAEPVNLPSDISSAVDCENLFSEIETNLVAPSESDGSTARSSLRFLKRLMRR